MSDSASQVTPARNLELLLATLLLVGVALLGAGGVAHPMLSGDAAADLRTIAETPRWRPIHLALLAG